MDLRHARTGSCAGRCSQGSTPREDARPRRSIARIIRRHGSSPELKPRRTEFPLRLLELLRPARPLGNATTPQQDGIMRRGSQLRRWPYHPSVMPARSGDGSSSRGLSDRTPDPSFRRVWTTAAVVFCACVLPFSLGRLRSGLCELRVGHAGIGWRRGHVRLPSFRSGDVPLRGPDPPTTLSAERAV